MKNDDKTEVLNRRGFLVGTTAAGLSGSVSCSARTSLVRQFFDDYIAFFEAGLVRASELEARGLVQRFKALWA